MSQETHIRISKETRKILSDLKGDESYDEFLRRNFSDPKIRVLREGNIRFDALKSYVMNNLPETFSKTVLNIIFEIFEANFANAILFDNENIIIENLHSYIETLGSIKKQGGRR